MKAGRSMNIKKLHPVEVRKVYLDDIGEWVEVPVFNQEEVIRLVNEVDWEGLDMRMYKKTLLEHWPGLSSSVKNKIKNPAARDELYDALVNENWGLAPAEALNSKSYYTETEAQNVQTWFSNGGKTKGRAPDVISFE